MKLNKVVTLFAITAMLCSCSGTGEKNVSISVGSWADTKNASTEKDLNYFYEKYDQDKYNIIVEDWQYNVEAFLMRAAIGQLPTIYDAYFTDIERIKNSGYGTDLTKQLTENGYMELLNDNVKQLLSKEGRIYAVPANGYVLGMIFNADLYRRAGLQNQDGSYKIPKTLDELVETAKVIKNQTGAGGFLIQADGNTGGWIFTNIAWEFGVKFIGKDSDGRWISMFDTPECVEALQWIKDLKWVHNVLPDNPFTNQNQSQALLATGQCAMLIDDPYGSINRMIETYGIAKEDIGAFRIPAGRYGNVALMGGKIYGINNSATDEQFDTAFKLMQEVVLPALEMDDNLKSRMNKKYLDMTKDNQFIGIKNVNMWKETAESKYRDELIERYRNVDSNLYDDYNRCLDSNNMEIRLEEPVCCQDLYRILTECIENVLKYEDSDPAELIHNASIEFQSEYLDKIN